MLFLLPVSLIALVISHVAAFPVDTSVCTPVRIIPILGPSYTTSPNIGAYCGALLLSSSRPTVAAPPSAAEFPDIDVKRACECVLASFQAKAAAAVASTSGSASAEGILVAGAAIKSLSSGLTSKEMEMRTRAGEEWAPYGRGAVPVPVGSEFKGYGARDNLYFRAGVVDGVRNRAN